MYGLPLVISLLCHWLVTANCFTLVSSKYWIRSRISTFSAAKIQPLYSSKKNSIIAPDIGNRTDYRSDADYIRNSIVQWLNTEFIDQECHYRIGDRVFDAYMRLRETGVTDAGEMMLEIGTSLETGIADFDKAFVGPWDIANRASDIIFELLDIEACECSAPRSVMTASSSSSSDPIVVQIAPDCRVSCIEVPAEKMRSLSSDFQSSMFARYNFLKQFLEGIIISV